MMMAMSFSLFIRPNALYIMLLLLFKYNELSHHSTFCFFSTGWDSSAVLFGRAIFFYWKDSTYSKMACLRFSTVRFCLSKEKSNI